jgi:hypothetical protein
VLSRKDFVMRIVISRKESKESTYWLNLKMATIFIIYWKDDERGYIMIGTRNPWSVNGKWTTVL